MAEVVVYKWSTSGLLVVYLWSNSGPHVAPSGHQWSPSGHLPPLHDLNASVYTGLNAQKL